MTKYSKIFQSTDFLQSVISSQKQPTAENLVFIHAVFKFIKNLAQTAHDSKDLTLLFSANDGLRICLGGSIQTFIKPTQKYLLFHFFDVTLALPARIMADLNLSSNLRKSPNCDYTMLEATADKLIALTNLITELAPDKTIDFEADSLTHPRYFPGDVREEVYWAFVAADRLCGGVNGKTKPHRLKLNDPIEYDHILPHSRGGASTLGNLQILCVACNRTKSGSAR